MSTWSLEHAKAIVAAWPEVQQYYGEAWQCPVVSDLHAYKMEFIGNPKHFRLPPKKTLVEWTASDVKPGMVFRHRTWSEMKWTNEYTVASTGISILGHDEKWRELMAFWLWSTDAVTWHPCAKEVEV